MNNYVWVYDLEVISNCFTAVFYNRTTLETREFVIHESRNDYDAFMKFLKEECFFTVGYNSIAYDGQILQAFLNGVISTNEDIYAFSQQLIDLESKKDLPYRKFSIAQLDLYQALGYSGKAKMSSLKWLMFSTRYDDLEDMPISHNQTITKTKIPKLLKYNHKDTDFTDYFYSLHTDEIKIRKELGVRYKDNCFLNKSDQQLGETVFVKELSVSMGVPEQELRKMRTYHNKISLKDCIPEYVSFSKPEFQDVNNLFKNKVVTSELKGAFTHEFEYAGVVYTFGTGGLHGANKSGAYYSDDDYLILDWDCSSYYPNLAIFNKFRPEHLGEYFSTVYSNLYEERKTYPKGHSLNTGLKLSLNGAFGKTNSEYSPLFDKKCFASITISGQLTLLMLAEYITYLAEIISVNTDGITFRIHKSKLEALNRAKLKFEEVTGQVLEEARYSRFYMRDVNSYWALTDTGKVKRKGAFEMYEDIANAKAFNKNPSATVIQTAVNNYLLDGRSIEDTIKSEQNMYEFCSGVKTKKNFNFVLWNTDKNNHIVPNVLDGRVIRYYNSTDGGCLYKHFSDSRIVGVEVGNRITPLMNMKKNNSQAYQNIDYDHYITEAEKLITSLNI